MDIWDFAENLKVVRFGIKDIKDIKVKEIIIQNCPLFEGWAVDGGEGQTHERWQSYWNPGTQYARFRTSENREQHGECGPHT